MKKVLSVFLAALMLLSAFSVISFAEEKYPEPAAPANLAFSAEGVASWDAVDVPSFTETDGYETSCVMQYEVTLARWDYDDKEETWTYVPVGGTVVTEETSLDLSAHMESGKYVFSVTAIAAYSRTMLSNGKIANFKKRSDKVDLALANAVQVTPDIFEEPVDTSIPFESLVKEDDEQAQGILKILKKIKEVFMIILRFLGFAGDVTGISDEIQRKNG